jgi:HD superfamily phosphohydrolase
MGNIKFISFPSFSAVTRYEHSVGVCHLANLASKSLNLSEKDKIELMIAALYHDVTTPPFAHAMEEILKIYSEYLN